MVASSRNSSRVLEGEIKAKAKRKKGSPSPEGPPRKRLRKDTGVFDFTSDSDENDTPAVNGHKGTSSNGLVGPDSKRKGPIRRVNDDTSSRPAVNGHSKLPRERRSPSLSPSDISSDEIDKISPRDPITPTKVPTRTSENTKSSKKKPPSINGLAKSIPQTSFNKRLVGVVAQGKEEKAKRNGTVAPSAAVTVAVPRSKTKSALPKGPTAKELDSIKAHVLGKLCGRIPIPLTGKSEKVAEYVP
jgi:hypothetical protein